MARPVDQAFMNDLLELLSGDLPAHERSYRCLAKRLGCHRSKVERYVNKLKDSQDIKEDPVLRLKARTRAQRLPFELEIDLGNVIQLNDVRAARARKQMRPVMGYDVIVSMRLPSDCDPFEVEAVLRRELDVRQVKIFGEVDAQRRTSSAS